ncbi:MAG: site-2 protease family protein [Eubacteriales bacterium]|nr:site-2 protease family protein [Eubacteriales bacterium]
MQFISIICAILALSIIILFHEFGHFIFAKIFKVGVIEFSLGMGPRIISFVKNNTRYSWKVIPFGGSCAMIGEDPSGSGDFSSYGGAYDENTGLVDFDGVKFPKDEISKISFNNIMPYKKLLIAFAGPLFNFILAFIVSLVIVFFTGIDKPIIRNVSENSPATIAMPYTLQNGDEILSLETPNKKSKVVVTRDITLFMYINDQYFTNEKYPLGITFKRDGQILETIVKPQYNEEVKRNIIGISFKNESLKPQNVIQLVQFTFYEIGFCLNSTITSLQLLFSGQLSANEISGPIGTVAIMGSSISEASTYGLLSGFLVFINLISVISANLGVMNLLPIPALDGGRIVFSIYEMISGRKVNEKVERLVNGASMLLLLLLMIFIMGSDIYKLIPFLSK